MREESLSRMSALLDGECSDAELDQLLDELEREPELGVTWSRLCRYRELRQGRVATVSATCICASVMARLDETGPRSDKVSPIWRRRELRLPRWAAPLGGLAAAASMGAAAVLLVQPGTPSESGVQGPGLASIGEPVSWATQQASAPVAASSLAEPVRTVAGREEPQGQMLHEYLIDHSNAVATEVMGGTMRYARFAAHEAEYRPMTLEYP